MALFWPCSCFQFLQTQKFLTPKRVIFGTEVDTSIDINTGRINQFKEGLSDSTTILDSSTPTDGIGIELTFPLIFTQGTGVTLSQNNAEFDGSSRLEQTISIGQDVATTSNVIFNQVSASSFITNGVTFDSNSISGSLVITGSTTTLGNITVQGNATVDGTITAQEFKTEFVSASIIFSSGSTRFGDTINDTHNFTGSLQVSGSFNLNGYNITEISNDTTLGDSSTTALVTENAVKTFLDDNTLSQQAYVRKQFVKTSSSVTGISTASFTAVTASAPSGLTSTNENDFIFFINGQYMEHDALEIQQAGSNFLLKVNNSSIGYDLESDDEIIAIGKFNS